MSEIIINNDTEGRLSRGEKPLYTKEVPLQTVRGLMVALQELMDAGHGDTAIMRADVECGPCSVNALELYDTQELQERGEVSAPLIFFIC